MHGSKKFKGKRGSVFKDVQGSKKLRKSERLRCQIGAGVKTFSGQIGSGVIEAQESESFVSHRGLRSESFRSRIGLGVRDLQGS